MINFVKKFFYDTLSNEISTITQYADSVSYVSDRTENDLLFDSIKAPKKQLLPSDAQFSSQRPDSDHCEVYILNGSFNYDLDIQSKLETFYKKMNRSSRLMLILYNPYWSLIFKLAGNLGLKKGGAPTTFLTKSDLKDLCYLTNFDIVRYRPTWVFPFKLFGLGHLINKMVSATPILRDISICSIVTLRPVIETKNEDVFLSIVIPARNEAGNIENALLRMPKFNFKHEIIFIEGNSTDNTWDEIQRVCEKYKTQFLLQYDRQTGKGKANAVEKGFAIAKGNLFTILDADLTMPPEMLPAFVNAYMDSKGDFVNGSRLLYPMEGKAMRFLNKLGNIFFANSLSFVLETRLTDSLCGTKLFTRKDYCRFMKWRESFGKFDPFGDFDLIFPASILGLGIINLPIRYLDRTYGETNISRFRHGFMLLKMTTVGLMKVRLRIF